MFVLQDRAMCVSFAQPCRSAQRQLQFALQLSQFSSFSRTSAASFASGGAPARRLHPASAQTQKSSNFA